MDECRYAQMGYVQGRRGRVAAAGLMDGAGTARLHRNAAKRGYAMMWPVKGDGGKGLLSS